MLIPKYNNALLLSHTVQPWLGGWQEVFRFQNGYGASVIRHTRSYGLEIAVARFFGDDPDDWDFDFDNKVADGGVLTYLTPETAVEALNRIALL